MSNRTRTSSDSNLSPSHVVALEAEAELECFRLNARREHDMNKIRKERWPQRGVMYHSSGLCSTAGKLVDPDFYRHTHHRPLWRRTSSSTESERGRQFLEILPQIVHASCERVRIGGGLTAESTCR